MPTIGPSIEDLLPSSKKDDDETAGGQLREKIEEINLKDKETEVAQIAQLLGLGYINLVGFPVGPDSLTIVNKNISRTNRAICFFNNGSEIRLGAVEYTDDVKKLSEEIAEKNHANVAVYLISQHSFDTAFKLYENLPEVKKQIAGIEITEEELKKYDFSIKNFKDLEERVKKCSITELVSLIVATAIKSRASDIHIEAEEKDIKVRYRVDGVLNDVADIDKEAWPKVISRIKQLSKLKINVSDRPQDGRFSIFLTNDRIDVRVSALPTAFGESVVMRLLMSSATQLSFEDLGLRGEAFKLLEREIDRPNGMIITTGPTGSGKTTTLYAILKRLNNAETKIITIEDPIEYELKGVNQSQVDKNYTFAKGLRSIVRQDPDIVMVGEIRDLETAEISIQAALTGHLVLSTIHTNDAFGAIPRFLSLGAKPFLLAPALNVAIGQRLVRRICPHCRVETTFTEEIMGRVNKLLNALPKSSAVDMNNLKFFRGTGCEQCQGLGYKGQIGIYEVMPIEGDIEQAITVGNMSEIEIKDMAAKHGVITMAQDGLLKALDGITTVDEIFRVAE